MSKFIEVKDSRYGDQLIINIDQISWIHEDAGVVCLAGVHGEKDGLRNFGKEEMAKIIEAVKKWGQL